MQLKETCIFWKYAHYIKQVFGPVYNCSFVQFYVRWPEYWFLFLIIRYTTVWYKTATALSETLKKIICSSLTALSSTVFQMKYPRVNLFKISEERKWVVSSSEIILFLFGESTKSYVSDWGLHFSVTTSPFVFGITFLTFY